MATIADILHEKGASVYTISPYSLVREAIRSMTDHRVGSLVVIKGVQVVGIITQRDYLHKLEGHADPLGLPVAALMSTHFTWVETTTTVERCLGMMHDTRCRHAPVAEHGFLRGLVSAGDLVRHLSAETAQEVRLLTEYITGTYPA